MRVLAFAVCLALVSATVPADAAAQIRALRAASSSPLLPVMGAGLPANFSPSLPLMPSAPSIAPSILSPSLPLPSLLQPVVLQPALHSVVSPAPATPAAVKPLSVRIEAAKALALALPKTSVSAAPAAASESFALLTGEALVPRDESSVLAAAATPEPPALPPSTPRAPDPKAAKNVRRMMIGTAVMKSGMETITLSVPMLALTAFGGISAVAGLVVIYGLSQAVFAAMAGGLADRFSARKVLAGAVVIQAALVATLIGVGAAGLLSMGTLIPLYLMIGGVTGVIETTRHSIPTLLLGQDEASLKKYNAKLHISYEVAGVIGALTAGALIGLVGPLWSLIIQPPAFALAAWFFWRVKHPLPAGGPPVSNGVGARIRSYFSDIKAGTKIVLGDRRMRWVALAFVLPQIVHRVFENLLIPVFAKKVLENPSASAWLLTASNMGELLGAVLLLKLASRFKGPSAWVKYGALGLLLIWALASTTALPILLPLILVSSLSWAASDLSLRSEVQGTVAENDQPRALSFLYGAFVVGSALLSLALGGLLDAMPTASALVWICGLFSGLAAAVFFASRRLKK